ncbi:phytoene desaturase family protein (plasmid) [Halobaculum sp. CBA1158]|uniref:phytoene desaturase family protein n=1 Tax=Halobaculum sp. CBA1158 TaxID=2904243 RepID=UPI001F233FE1|nr:phytoene desaturase family protein [Halobaculum sp. CBA1158]UIP01414.1 phytoene desaturase family protein [Halobaculum sp. CBA1158]
MSRDPEPDAAPLADREVAVIGGGIGGLSAACYLADDGADVTVYERGDRVGGVAGRIERDGFAFDTGPSWYLQPEVFERFFAHFDRDPGDFYDLVELDPKYRVFWTDGDRASVPADRAAVRDLFESYEPGAGESFEAYLERAREAYELGMDRFVYTDRDRLRDMLDLDVLRSGRALPLLRTMDEHVDRYVDHPKLEQLLEYTLVFLGGSPYNTPALYSMLSWADHGLGVHYPDGGMYRVVEALRDLGDSLGVDYRTGTEVTAVAGRRGTFSLSLADAGGDAGDAADTTVASAADAAADTPDAATADLVVCDVPPATADRDLLPPGDRIRGDDAWNDATFAPSAYMLYLGVEGDVEPLAHHSLVLPTDWDDHFDSIFEDPAWPDDPAYYVNVPSRTDDGVAPDGHETVVVLVPVASGLRDDPTARSRFRDRVLADLAETTGVDLRDRIVVEEEACVSEFAARFGEPEGTALGLAHTLDQTGPLRPSHRAGPDGFYLVGSDTTPGIGVPMCLISGEHAAAAVRGDETGSGRLPLPSR